MFYSAVNPTFNRRRTNSNYIQRQAYNPVHVVTRFDVPAGDRRITNQGQGVQYNTRTGGPVSSNAITGNLLPNSIVQGQQASLNPQDAEKGVAILMRIAAVLTGVSGEDCVG